MMKRSFFAILSTVLMLTGCQMAKELDPLELPDDGAISLSSYKKTFDSAGGTVDVRVASSGESDAWILKGESSWVHPSSLSGVSGDVVKFTVDPNETDKELRALFTFALQHGDTEATFEITVAGKETDQKE